MYETPKPLCKRCAKLLKLETVRKVVNVKKGFRSENSDILFTQHPVQSCAETS